MLTLLAMVEGSPASATALEAACQLDPGNHVHPVYTAPSADHDLVMGAGWAWKTWERENRRRARKDVEHLVSIQRQQCKNLKAPIVVSGRPIKSVSRCFFDNGHDLVVAGTPFRGMDPKTLARRFQRAIRGSSRDLPLWIVKDSRPVKTVTALTDGSDPAEKALGILNRLVCNRDIQITLIGLTSPKAPAMDRDALNLERGFAILKEKGIMAQGFTRKRLGPAGLRSKTTETDLIVMPFSPSAGLKLFDRPESQFPSVLFYLDGDTG